MAGPACMSPSAQVWLPLLLLILPLPVWSTLPPSDNHASTPVHQGEVALHVCKASERRRITIGSDVFRLTHLYVVPMPAVKVGGEISLKLEGAISSDALPFGLSTANISLQLVSTSSSSLSKEGPSTGVLVDSHLCSLLGWRNFSDCPVIKRSIPPHPGKVRM